MKTKEIDFGNNQEFQKDFLLLEKVIKDRVSIYLIKHLGVWHEGLDKKTEKIKIEHGFVVFVNNVKTYTEGVRLWMMMW